MIPKMLCVRVAIADGDLQDVKLVEIQHIQSVKTVALCLMLIKFLLFDLNFGVCLLRH
jgi:hypothetical protein